MKVHVSVYSQISSMCDFSLRFFFGCMIFLKFLKQSNSAKMRAVLLLHMHLTHMHYYSLSRIKL